MKVEKKAYGTKGLIETHLASKSSPPTIDDSMNHVTRFVSRYSLIYGHSDLIWNDDDVSMFASVGSPFFIVVGDM